MRQRWDEVEAYLDRLLIADDPVLAAAHAASAAAGLPPHQVSPSQGKLLGLLVGAVGAERVLELGTLAAVSTIWMARALPESGRLLTIELEPAYAEVARSNLARAGLSDCVEVIVGLALEVLAKLHGEPPFDLVFIDADKASNGEYLEAVLARSRRGTLIVADNVVREGAIADPGSSDPRVAGIRCFFEALAGDPRIEATAVQTVGSKGWDGFALARVVSGPGVEGADRSR